MKPMMVLSARVYDCFALAVKQNMKPLLKMY